jgi:hypothetical protein
VVAPLRRTRAFAGLLVVFGCSTAQPVSPDARLAVEIANFRLSATDVAYDMKYGLFEPSVAGMSARVAFENPADRNNPLVVEVALPDGAMEFNAVSPPIHCIANGRRYRVDAQLIHDGRVVDALSQDLLFRVPAGLLKTMDVDAC